MFNGVVVPEALGEATDCGAQNQTAECHRRSKREQQPSRRCGRLLRDHTESQATLRLCQGSCKESVWNLEGRRAQREREGDRGGEAERPRTRRAKSGVALCPADERGLPRATLD